MGDPVDDLYTAASRHVDGHAARRRRRGDRSPSSTRTGPADQLKDALISTAKTQPTPDRLPAGRGPGRPDPGGRAEGVRHRGRGLRPADRGRRVEPHDHLPQPGRRPDHVEPVRRRHQPGRGQAGNRRVRCPGDCHGPGRRQHRRTREPDRDQARPRPAQRLDRCHRPRWDRHPHRGRRPPVRPEAQGHAARRRPRRAAHRRPGRLAVRRQLAIGRTRLDPGRVELHRRGRGRHVPAALAGGEQRPAGRAGEPVHRPEHRGHPGHRGGHRRPQGGADHDRDAQAVRAAGGAQLLRAPRVRERPVHQPRRDALQHGQAGERDPDQAGQGRQLRVLVPLATGRADGPGVGIAG